MISVKPRFPLFGHQHREVDMHLDDLARCLWWEMGLGKTLAVLIRAAQLFKNGKIDCLFVLAPSGLSHNWINIEVPKHMPEETPYIGFAWSTERAHTQGHEKAANSVLTTNKLAIVSMSYDALLTEKGKAFAGQIVRKRRCLIVADEGRRIKNPSAKRTKVALKAATFCPYRMILNGTPVTQSPFDLYSQLMFVDPGFWLPLGISGYTAYKNYFGVFKKGFVNTPSGVREFPQLVSFRNLNVLKNQLDRNGNRITKEEVLNLPPKLYTKLEFELTRQQDLLYRQLEEDYMAILDNGEMVSAPIVLTRLLRHQQIASGYVPVDNAPDDYPFHEIPGGNPRMELLADLIEDVPHSTIIWARFRRTVDSIMGLVGKRGVRYDGTTGEDERAEAIDRFQSGDAKFFVSTGSAGGEGITLTRAQTVIRAERVFDLAIELQAEARSHRIGQANVVNYIDLVGKNTVDEKIAECLEKKMKMAAEITGDDKRVKGSLT